MSWSKETEERLGRAADALAEHTPEMAADIRAALDEIKRLTQDRDEWKRIAYAETKGSACVWAGKFESAERELAEERIRSEHEESALRCELEEQRARADRLEADPTSTQEKLDRCDLTFVGQQQQHIATLEAALRTGDAWRADCIMLKLADAADHLLHHHACDAHGYEEVSVCVLRARECAAAIAAALAAQPAQEGKGRCFADVPGHCRCKELRGEGQR